jgi:hypothetical protein
MVPAVSSLSAAPGAQRRRRLHGAQLCSRKLSLFLPQIPNEIGFSTAGIAGIDFERHSGWGRDCHRDSLQRSHSDVSHDGDFAKQEPSYRACHHGNNEQISDATASELSATPGVSPGSAGSVARASRKCHGCNRKTPRRLRVGRELYAEESVQLRAVQEAMKATDSLAVANSDASEMVCHVNHVID